MTQSVVPRPCSISDPQFQTATRLRSRVPTRVGLLVCLPFCEGRRSAERRIVNKPRLISRIAGKQHHTATPPGAPPRRLKTLVRSSGDLATLGDFAPHACPRPASSQWQSPVVGPDGNPGPPEPVLARHNLRRRIRPVWVTPPRPRRERLNLETRSPDAEQRVALRGALQSRGRSARRYLGRSRFCEAALRNNYVIARRRGA